MQRTPTADASQSNQFAKVALPLPLATVFTYSIPPEYRDKVFIGCRVEVPFGQRVLSGIVVELDDQSDLAKTKPVREIYETYLPHNLLQLTTWIANYYGCSLGEAAQSVLPPLLKRAKRAPRMTGSLRLSTQSEAELDKLLKRAPKQLALAERLRTTGSASVQTIVDEWGFAPTLVKSLLQKGVAELSRANKASPLDSIDVDVADLTDEQQSAMARIDVALASSEFKPILLHGVTGSGKTELYLRAAKRVLHERGGCIVLVPEIGLLPQAIARYERVFGEKLAVLHSRMTGPERFDIWEKISDGTKRIVLGPRSAIFSPVQNLRLVVVDEEQDDSYKQDDKPRYHARHVALMRGKLENLTVVLGSATPSAESLYYGVKGKYERLNLLNRVGDSVLPEITYVDMRDATIDGAFFSSHLVERLEHNIAAGHQSILFLNKRGHARYVQCNACGEVSSCPNCDISLTYHRVANRLRCHFCGHNERSPNKCKTCESPRLYFAGVGTQRIELDLAALMPGVPVLRMDADTTSGKEGHRRVLEKFSTGDFPILVGTQMVTKGHHFPRVNLVGVLFAEDSLNYPDFRSAERTFQQLTQVAGRAGRGEHPGEVIVQTFLPEHHVFRFLETYDYDGFMREELKLRKQLNYPPFSRIVLASCSAPKAEVLNAVICAWTQRIRQRLRQKRVDVLGPVPPMIARIKNRYREQVLLKGRLTNNEKTQLLEDFAQVAKSIPGGRSVELRWDVDPEGFL